MNIATPSFGHPCLSLAASSRPTLRLPAARVEPSGRGPPPRSHAADSLPLWRRHARVTGTTPAASAVITDDQVEVGPGHVQIGVGADPPPHNRSRLPGTR